MAAGEKKSLTNNESRPSQRRPTGFKLHYFPDIPVDGPVGVQRCSPPEDNFQRARYDNTEPVCTQSESGAGGMNPLYKRRGLTADKQGGTGLPKRICRGLARR